MRQLTSILIGAGLGIAAAIGTAQAADDIVIGLQCDRTGPTQTVGVFLCPGYHDYIKLVNSYGGVGGHKIRVIEIDHEYKVPQAVEGYQLFKKEGAVLVGLYGTPQTQALTQRLTEDQIPGTSPGFGTAAAANGKRYPYIFPIAATYWSQGAAAVQYAKDKLGGLKGKKIAYLYYDNPAGREPLPILNDLEKMEGFEMKTFAVPPPGIEMGPQVLDITRRFRADFVIAHLFGRAPSVAVKELKRAGYPLNQVVSFVWGHSEADVKAAGGWETAEGYSGVQFAGLGSDYAVHDEIRALYKVEGKPEPDEMASTTYYNRGMLIAAVHIAGIENAVKAKGGGKITGADVKAGLEAIKGLSLGGLVPPLEITAADHEGGGWVKVFQVKGGKFQPATDWFKAYPEVLAKHLNAE